MRLLLALTLVLFLCTCGSAQKVMLLEKVGKAGTERVYEGETLRFKMQGDNFWQEGRIEEMRPDIQALVINDRFILLENIHSLHRGSTFGKAAGLSLMTFGVVWTTIGLLGYNTDGDPDSQISGGQLAVGAGSFATGYILNRFLGQKKFKLGRKKRLRIIDTTF
ncbi:hypothetical protein [Lewinella sp. 4G2]|uniref:hypothetical protein n=1 Tax=Lewinella sp. 4G2 TaxID=1803372 RepID=UPI0007B45F62|nr:hypothetical protein [Lewinella sp. 4G2]OAV43529.1 hypothetical protein A3850_003030 [Lewinella sp. 4G2]